MMEGRPFRRRPSREHFQAPPRSFLVLGGGPAIHGVLNGFSEVVLDVFGPDIGGHARTAIGVAALPLDLPVVVAAELELA
nr:hypothetical protein [Rhodococcus wratislaviensis]GLK35650.1 hypothetical protein GCM10017611_25050 [Rhodococcus wratislaviensis]